jgi:hypothetical protein
MTEDEWRAFSHPEPMLIALGETVTERKCRLLACACCRRIWHLMTDERVREAIKVAEQLADGLATQRQRKAAYVLTREIQSTANPSTDYRAFSTAMCAHFTLNPAANRQAAIMNIAGDTANAVGYAVEHCEDRSKDAEHAAQSELVRDLFSSPLRLVALDLKWRTDIVLSLASQMYDLREFSAMPILADTLQDAGCDNTDILDHCRGPGQHVRGCWVVDLILGKK